MSGSALETSQMFAEAAEIADVVAGQLSANAPLMRELGERLRGSVPRGVVTFARGSSDHAATFAKYVFETRAHVLTTSAAPSVMSVYGRSLDLSGMVALAISQSGRSPDILAAAAGAKAGGALALALINEEQSPLAAVCDITIPLHAGPERSIAATKSYAAALSAILHLVAEWHEAESLAAALHGAPTLLRQAWSCDCSPLVQLLVSARNLFVIGRGPGFGIAQEAALKLKETSGIHAEAFSAAEVRHGPMTLIGPDLPLLVFRQSDETAAGIDELVMDARRRGSPVLVVGSADMPVPTAHPLIQPMLQITAFYRAANTLAVARGLNPDRPPHLTKVTETL